MSDTKQKQLQENLTQLLGNRMNQSAASLKAHSRDESWHSPQSPFAVCYPHTSEEVSKIISLCKTYQFPITPFGAGTSVEGNSIPAPGGICVDLTQMKQILAVSETDRNCRVEAGVTRLELNDRLKNAGLFFPVDPGANATLGGMCSTRASGTNAVRYGTMKDNVLGLTVVTADGRVIHTGNRAPKSASGYDLTRLFTGAEGTLGIITEITLKLYGIPETTGVATISLAGLDEAMTLVINTLGTGIPIARLELLDDKAMAAVNRYANLHLPETHTLFFEFHGSQQSVAEQAQWVSELASELGNHPFHWAVNQEDKNRLWQARHDALYAAKALVPGAAVWTTDVCVPLSRLKGCIIETSEDIQHFGLQAPIVGHVGDGNFHLLIVLPENDDVARNKAKQLNERLIERALEAGGTCSGEHGIGLGKKHWMAREHGESLQVMQTLKHALDPDNLFNPGKLLP